MSTMIERVAQAIRNDELFCQAMEDGGQQKEFGDELSTKLASISIEALREPTEEIVKAWEYNFAGDEQAMRGYLVAIDAILKEEQ